MTPENWVQIVSLVIDLLKTLIPYTALFFILWYFKKEIRTLLTRGNVKINTPGFSLETTQQAKEITKEEKKEINAINKELKKIKEPQIEKAIAIQHTTIEDNQSLFLSYHFERTYRIIFPTQMEILMMARIHEGSIAEKTVESLFQKTLWYHEYHMVYDDFIHFLFISGLMVKNQSMLQLTPIGYLFLDYLQSNTIPPKLPPTDQMYT